MLVNNAGMSPLYDSLDAVSEELYDKTLAVNLKGPFRLAVLAATRMAAGDGGSIINIGTTASLTASVRELPYACAKAGLNALTVGLAEAYAPKVRVNAILPGPFRTDISQGCPIGHNVPLYRFYAVQGHIVPVRGRPDGPRDSAGAGSMSSLRRLAQLHETFPRFCLIKAAIAGNRPVGLAQVR